jgi:hypothetical protein
VVADGSGHALAFALAPGQAHELPLAPGLLGCLSDAPGWVVADRGLASHAFRALVWDSGARPAIPSKRNEEPMGVCKIVVGDQAAAAVSLWSSFAGRKP